MSVISCDHLVSRHGLTVTVSKLITTGPAIMVGDQVVGGNSWVEGNMTVAGTLNVTGIVSNCTVSGALIGNAEMVNGVVTLTANAPVGDGVADDHVALQEIVGGGDKCVVLRAGATYRLGHNSLTLGHNTILNLNGSTIKRDADAVGVTGGTVITIDSADKVTVMNGIIDGGQRTVADAGDANNNVRRNTSCLSVVSSNWISLKNLEIMYGGYGVNASTVSGLDVEMCHIHDNRMSNVYIVQVENGVFSNCDLSYAAWPIFTQYSLVKFQNCVVKTDLTAPGSPEAIGLNFYCKFTTPPVVGIMEYLGYVYGGYLANAHDLSFIDCQFEAVGTYKTLLCMGSHFWEGCTFTNSDPEISDHEAPYAADPASTAPAEQCEVIFNNCAMHNLSLCYTQCTNLEAIPQRNWIMLHQSFYHCVYTPPTIGGNIGLIGRSNTELSFNTYGNVLFDQCVFSDAYSVYVASLDGHELNNGSLTFRGCLFNNMTTYCVNLTNQYGGIPHEVFSKSFVVFDGCKFNNWGSSAIYIQYNNPDIAIRNCYFAETDATKYQVLADDYWRWPSYTPYVTNAINIEKCTGLRRLGCIGRNNDMNMNIYHNAISDLGLVVYTKRANSLNIYDNTFAVAASIPLRIMYNSAANVTHGGSAIYDNVFEGVDRDLMTGYADYTAIQAIPGPVAGQKAVDHALMQVRTYATDTAWATTRALDPYDRFLFSGEYHDVVYDTSGGTAVTVSVYPGAAILISQTYSVAATLYNYEILTNTFESTNAAWVSFYLQALNNVTILRNSGSVGLIDLYNVPNSSTAAVFGSNYTKRGSFSVVGDVLKEFSGGGVRMVSLLNNVNYDTADTTIDAY